MRAISQLDVSGRRLVVRADLNVPIHDGRVIDTARIDRFAHGARSQLARGASLVILTHRGRPGPEAPENLSTRPLLVPLAAALGVGSVAFADSCTGSLAVKQSRNLAPGEAMLCENLRFHPGETANDPEFAASLARLGDLYVNDAFSCCHRAHASIEALARLLPAACGPLLTEEFAALSAALETPQRPAVAVIGGAKISTKIAVLKTLASRFDAMVVGGAMANTFLAAGGARIGRSLHEPDQTDLARHIMTLAKQSKCEIALPVDAVCASAPDADARTTTTDVHSCPDDMMILDAGPRSLARFSDILRRARTIVWNGPLGAFEIPPFDRATCALARVAAELTQGSGITSVAGGGDTVAALNAAGVADRFSYVSTAGGAFLEWLEGGTLPGVAALESHPALA